MRIGIADALMQVVGAIKKDEVSQKSKQVRVCNIIVAVHDLRIQSHVKKRVSRPEGIDVIYPVLKNESIIVRAVGMGENIRGHVGRVSDHVVI
jgi:hypothetical protein